MDGDGDNDILSASGGDNKIAWYENILEGCMDEEACNYNPIAETDNQSCLLLGDIVGDGNVNVDNSIDIEDIILILSHILDIEYLGSTSCAADCNADGTIDLLDIILIVNIILGND